MRILLYGYSSEEDQSSDEDGDTYSPIPDSHFDSVRPTPSLSLTSTHASSDISEPTSQHMQASPFSPPTPLPSKSYFPEFIVPRPLSHHSAIYQTEPTVPTDEADAQPFLPEPETPMETATPILYFMPHTRPSIISIKTSIPQPNIKSPRRAVSMPHSPPIPRRSEQRISAVSLTSVSSAVELPITSPHSLPGESSNTDRSFGTDGRRRRPVMFSVNNDLALQYEVSSCDGSLRRSIMASSCKVDQPVIRNEQSQTVPTALSPTLFNTRRTASVPTLLGDPESTMSTSLPAVLNTKKVTSQLGKTRSSIGLAIRNASSPLKSKNASSRSSTSKVTGSMESKDGIDGHAISLRPPSPLFQQSCRQQSKSPAAFSGSSRLRRVTAAIGL